MKKQKNSSIKAQLLRRASLSLLLVAVCIIPFAWGQRNTVRTATAQIKRNAVAHAAQMSNVYGRAPVVSRKSPIAPFLLNRPLGGTCPSTITESTSQAIVDGNSVACNDGVGHTDNSYWRAFDMATFTGGQEYDVTSVSFGIESATSGSGTGQPVTVNLYIESGAPFPTGTRTLLATSGELNIPDQADTIFTVPLIAVVPAGTLELVMEVFTPNGQAQGNLFFIGSNTDPETVLSYISAADCGNPDPTPVGDIGFPNMHIVFNVNGSCPTGSPTPTPTATTTPRLTPTPRPRPTPRARPTPPTVSPTPTPIATATSTPTGSPMVTPTVIPTATATATSTPTGSPTLTPTVTPPPTPTPSPTPRPRPIP